MTIKVIINGANGRMGQEAVKAVNEDNTLELVGKAGKEDNLSEFIKSLKAQVVVDLTTAEVGFDNTLTILEAGASAVVGTSGFMPEHIETIKERCKALNRGCIIAPNFSLGAVLMMKYAAEIAKYLPQAEIIEYHHDKKIDAPSGTAMKTAELIAQHRHENFKAITCEKELIQGARGAEHHGVPIHAVRLPGLVAHQQVIFGSHFETLCIKHDSLHRASFMPGILLCCKKVVTLNQLVYGLENIL